MYPFSQLILAAQAPATGTWAMPLPLDPALLPAGVLLITGAFMLLAGRRLLRAGLGITGALMGALIGNALGIATASLFSPVAWTILGALAGLALGLLLWRFTVASIMAGSCAAVAVLAVLLAVQSGFLTPIPLSTAATTEAGATTDMSTLVVEPTGSFDPPPAQGLDDAVASAATEHAREQARQWWRESLTRINTAATTWLGAVHARLASTLTRVWGSWKHLDPTVRTALGGVALLGALFGFLFGLVAGRWSGSIATVVAGAGLVLVGGLMGLEILVPSTGALFGGVHPGIWLLGWAGLAGGGSLIQWHAERRRADIEDALET